MRCLQTELYDEAAETRTYMPKLEQDIGVDHQSNNFDQLSPQLLVWVINQDSDNDRWVQFWYFLFVQSHSTRLLVPFDTYFLGQVDGGKETDV